MLKILCPISIGFSGFYIGLIYGWLNTSLGNFVLSSFEYKCTKTALVGKSPNREESCVRYEQLERNEALAPFQRTTPTNEVRDE